MNFLSLFLRKVTLASNSQIIFGSGLPLVKLARLCFPVALPTLADTASILL